MAYSKLTISAVAGQQAYTVTFPALEKDHIKATVDGFAAAYTISGTYQAGGSTITFTSPVFAGDEVIEIWRETPQTQLVDYVGGSPITEEDLDTSNLQHLYLEEETRFILDDEYQKLVEKNQPDGYAGLDGDGKLDLTQMGGDSNASANRYLRDDGTWQPVVGGGGTSGVYGPLTTVVDNVPLWNSTEGNLLSDSGLAISDLLDLGNATGTLAAGSITGLADVATSGDYTDLINQPTIPAELDDLDDVAAPTPQDGDVLTWDDASGKWIAAVGGGGGGGTGNVQGPSTSTETAIAVWGNTSGTVLTDSTVKVDSAGDIILAAGATVDGVDVSALGATVTGLSATAPTADQKAALAGTAGTPSDTNRYTTDADTRLDPFVGDDGNSGTAQLPGLVPAPAHGDAAGHKYLFSDGTWKRVDAAQLTGKLGLAAGGTAAGSASEAMNNILPQVDNTGSGITAAALHKGAVLIRNTNAIVPTSPTPGWVPLKRGADGTYLTADSTTDEGVKWATPPGGGNVSIVGPTHTDGNFPVFDGDDTGVLIDSGVSPADMETSIDPSLNRRVHGGIYVDHHMKVVRCVNIPRTPQIDAHAGTGGELVFNQKQVVYWKSGPVTYADTSGGGSGCAGLLFFRYLALRPDTNWPWRYVFYVRCPDDLTTLRLAIGLFNYNPTGYINPDPSLDHQAIYFRYQSGETKWSAVTSNGNNFQATSLSAGPDVSADAFHTLELVGKEQVVDSPYEVDFIINGTNCGTFAFTADYLPGSAAGQTGYYSLWPAIRLANTAAATRRIGFAGMTYYFTI